MKNYYLPGPRRILILSVAVLATTVTVLALSDTGSAYSGVAQEQRVRDFVEAFNARNIDAMLELVDENVQWLNVSGAKISVEVEGKEPLRQSMDIQDGHLSKVQRQRCS
jgi:hypothetical protein